MTPLHVLTGFLGSGKTTVLSHLLREPRGERLAVLVNEVGEIALDHHLLERIDEDVLALPSGCVCCTVRGELYEAVDRVLRLGPSRIVLETTGLADPAPIVHGLASDPRLRESVRIGGVVAVVDAARGEELLLTQPEARRQLELADRVLVTKVDLAPERAALLRARLDEDAPGRAVREAVHGEVDPAWLFQTTSLERIADTADASRWLHHHAGDPDFTSHVVKSDEPVDVAAVELWLGLVTQLDGPRLLRVKALAECRETGDVFVLQSAGHAVSPSRRLAQRPQGLHGMQAVLIERGLGAPAVARLLDSLREAARGARR